MTTDNEVRLLREVMQYGTFPEDSAYGQAVLNAANELERLTVRVADLEQQLRYWEQRAMGAGHG